ncbi:MAG: lasso peptide biosynthesis B2 protein [Pseudonocardiaceae bacterium]
MAPPTTSSWGTSEVPAAISPRRSTGFAVTALAGLALAGVLAARDLGRSDRSFSRIIALIGAAAGWPRRAADPQMVADALHCVRNIASVLPFGVACLEETAAAMLVLALFGRRAGWCHGVAADPIRLHAWIALDGQPVAEPASTTRYTPLLQIP